MEETKKIDKLTLAEFKTLSSTIEAAIRKYTGIAVVDTMAINDLLSNALEDNSIELVEKLPLPDFRIAYNRNG